MQSKLNRSTLSNASSAGPVYAASFGGSPSVPPWPDGGLALRRAGRGCCGWHRRGRGHLDKVRLGLQHLPDIARAVDHGEVAEDLFAAAALALGSAHS